MLPVQSDSLEFLFKRKIFLKIQKESLQVIQGKINSTEAKKIIEIFQDK